MRDVFSPVSHRSGSLEPTKSALNQSALNQSAPKLTVVRLQISEFNEIDVANVMYGCVAMQLTPGLQALDALAQHVNTNYAQYGSSEMAQVRLPCCAWLVPASYILNGVKARGAHPSVCVATLLCRAVAPSRLPRAWLTAAPVSRCYTGLRASLSLIHI